MSNDPKSTYGFDPFGADGKRRWGGSSTSQDIPSIPGYEIIDALGSGGMGSVWSARYLQLNQIRAVKVLDRSLSLDNAFVERFSQEAKALGKLQHPNIVRVFDANTENDPPFIAMQWVEGITLSEVLQKRELELDEAIRYFEQIASALDYAHSLGFVHRDIKPSNVMVTEKGDAMLIDFGVANFLGADAVAGTTLTGTTRYLAPEVIAGRMATHASDLWALAVLMYRVLTGTLPFDASGTDGVLKKIVSEPPTPPQKVAPRVAKFLVDALQKDPAKRYSSATEMAQALRSAAKPWVPKVEKERVAVSSAFLLLGAVVLAAVVGIGSFTYSVLSKPRVQTRTVTRVVSRAVPATNPSASPVAGAAAITNSLRGVWFADFGTRWAEARFTPDTGRTIKIAMSIRDQNGANAVAATGTIANDDRSFEYQEDGQQNAPSFKGSITSDRTQILGTSGGLPARFLRAGDLPIIDFPNAEEGFVAGVPAGWTGGTTDDGANKVTTISPYGAPDVQMRIVVSACPAGRSLADLIGEREELLAADAGSGGDYKRLSMNENASLAGRTATALEFRHQKAGGTPMHGLITGTLRGDRFVTAESWCPADRDDIWGPLFERMTKKLRFTD